MDLKENRVLFATGFKLECQDPLAVCEMVVPLPELPTPHPGVFALEILCDEELLGSHRVTAQEPPEIV